MACLGVAIVAVSAAAQESLDRTKRPSPLVVPTVHLPAIQKSRLMNGLAVWLVEKHDLPIVTFNLVIQAGSDHDPLD
jgi:zinc protease